MKTLTLNHFVDPGHSWIEIHKEFAANLIGSGWRRAFSSFSHENDDFVYLEEDDDAQTLKIILETLNYELHLKRMKITNLAVSATIHAFNLSHHD